MKIVNIIGVFVGIAGMVLTFLNTHLEYAEGPNAPGGIMNKHDDVGNVFRLLCFLFSILTAICVANWYKMARKKTAKQVEGHQPPVR